MATLTGTPCYFILVMDGKPFMNPAVPDMPMVFQDEQSALSAADRLHPSTRPEQVVLEWYSDNFNFLGRQPIQHSTSAPE